MGHSRHLFHLMLVLFKQAVQFSCSKISSAGIWTHDLSIMSFLQWPLDQGFRPKYLFQSFKQHFDQKTHYCQIQSFPRVKLFALVTLRCLFFCYLICWQMKSKRITLLSATQKSLKSNQSIRFTLKYNRFLPVFFWRVTFLSETSFLVNLREDNIGCNQRRAKALERLHL